VAEGFTAIELPTTWMPLAELPPARRDELFATIDDLGLSVPGISLARASIIRPGHEQQNLRLHHDTIDIAAERGVGFVCIGLHEPLLPRQQEALWFWDAPGPGKPSDPEVYAAAVRGFHELGAHAAEAGVSLTLEMYEDTFLGTADEAVRLLHDVDSEAVGLNPDIGNLLRLNRPVDTWEYALHRMLPHTNYWHVKNYTRSALADTGQFATAPVPLELGIIDYRKALAFAFAQGFDGPIVTEHYGGDGIHISAINREYLRELMRAAA
jgi:sugar phosphate isomerase/epimerase